MKRIRPFGHLALISLALSAYAVSLAARGPGGVAGMVYGHAIGVRGPEERDPR